MIGLKRERGTWKCATSTRTRTRMRKATLGVSGTQPRTPRMSDLSHFRPTSLISIRLRAPVSHPPLHASLRSIFLKCRSPSSSDLFHVRPCHPSPASLRPPYSGPSSGISRLASTVCILPQLTPLLRQTERKSMAPSTPCPLPTSAPLIAFSACVGPSLLTGGVFRQSTSRADVTISSPGRTRVLRLVHKTAMAAIAGGTS
ncbi:hypothetical protein GY45DRAFT_1018029 [Cubamyces sp. BRFM 1775]|nr:hypothetical protein GY45DRAFT_1018029 [Cubamyces sp. BRFM 1775]